MIIVNISCYNKISIIIPEKGDLHKPQIMDIIDTKHNLRQKLVISEFY
jgi:hypothetical protein